MRRVNEASPIAPVPFRKDISVRLGGFLVAQCDAINEATEFLKTTYPGPDDKPEISLVYRDAPGIGVAVTLVHGGENGAGVVDSDELWQAYAIDHEAKINGRTQDMRKGMTRSLFRAFYDQVLSRTDNPEALRSTMLSGEGRSDFGHPNIGFVNSLGDENIPSVASGYAKKPYVFRPSITIAGPPRI